MLALSASTIYVNGENFDIITNALKPDISKNTPLKNNSGRVINVPVAKVFLGLIVS